MVDKTTGTAGPRKLKDMSDGTFAEVVVLGANPAIGIGEVDVTNFADAAALADGAANPTTALVGAAGQLFNGATWDRSRNHHEVTLLASAARTATSTGADQTNYNARAAYIVIDVTAGAAAPGLTPAIQAKDSLSGKYIQIHANLTKITAIGTYTYFFALGTPAAAGGVTASSGFPLPRVWRLVVTADDATSYTYSAAVNYIV